MKAFSDCRLLLVDDTKTNIDILVHGLKDNYKLSIALNGTKAIEIAKSQKPDLILLDIMMPGIDGYEVCQQLKEDEDTCLIPIIFVTAMGQEEDEKKRLELGAVDYIRKPFSMPIVKARVKTHLSLKLAMEELESRNEELREAARLREDVERMSRHDLKNPLQVIVASPVMIKLLGDTLNEEQVNYMNRVERAGYRMLDMINRSLDLFKMETGVYNLKPEPVDLVEVIRKIRFEHQRALKEKGVELVIIVVDDALSDKGEFIITGEALLCYSMFSNLIKNALDASPLLKEISITMEKGERSIIQIHNQGAVPVEIRDRFFEKYITSGKEGGTGLGTYSARLIAETQGGSIHLDSSEEDGTTITISF
jgi:two-component system, sensor histidine kinase and response regulator